MPTLGFQYQSNVDIWWVSSMCTQVIVWVNIFMNHINSRTFLPKYEGFCMVYRPNEIENKHQRSIS